jgi:hypothetical protein
MEWLAEYGGVFSYETQNGLAIEVDGEVLPTFVAESNTLVWWDPNSWLPFQKSWLETLVLDPSERDLPQLTNFGFSAPAEPSPESQIITAFGLRSQFRASVEGPTYTATYAVPFEEPAYLLSFSRIDQIRWVKQVFEPRLKRFIAHKVTLGSKLWLIPAYIQRSVETAAKIHAVHFEDVIRTRKHSGWNDRQSVFRTLWRSRFAWVRWLFNKSLVASCTQCSRTLSLCVSV